MTRVLKIITQIVFWFFLIIFQISFISSLGLVFYNIPLFLVVLSFFIIFHKDKQLILILFFSGFLLDMFFFYQFGLFTVSLLLSYYILKFLQTNFLTNRSFYTVIILSLLYVILFNLIFNFLDFFIFLFTSSTQFFLFKFIFWQDLFYQLLFALILSITFFYAMNSMSKNLKSDFLDKS